MAFLFNVFCQAFLSHGDSSVSSLCLFKFPLPAFLLFIALMSSTCVFSLHLCPSISPIPMDRGVCVPLVSLSLFSVDRAQCVSFFTPVVLAFDCIISHHLNWTPSCSLYSFEQMLTKSITMNNEHKTDSVVNFQYISSILKNNLQLCRAPQKFRNI